MVWKKGVGALTCAGSSWYLAEMRLVTALLGIFFRVLWSIGDCRGINAKLSGLVLHRIATMRAMVDL